MGWISDIWDSITDWVRNLLSKALAWIVGKIEDFTVWLKITRHKFNIWLADFASTTLGFWLTLGGAVVIVMGLVFVTRSAWAAKAKLAVNAFLLKMKSTTGTVLGVLKYSEIYSLHQIAKILMPNYRTMWIAFYKAMGALAEEIGLGIGTITAFLRNANNVILSTYTAIGYTPDEAEVIYMRDSNEFFSKVDDRFSGYARNPESIFTDINNEIVRPHLLAQGEKDYKMALILNDVANKVIETDDNIQVVENNLKTLVEDLPDEIDAAISARTDVFFDTIDEFRDEHIIPVIEKLDGVRNVVNDYITTQERQRVVWESMISRPGDLLAQIETLPEPERSEQKRLLAKLIGALNLNGLSNLTEDRIASSISAREKREVKPDEILPPLVIKQPVDRLIIQPLEITSTVKSWFVGEY